MSEASTNSTADKDEGVNSFMNSLKSRFLLDASIFLILVIIIIKKMVSVNVLRPNLYC